MTTIAYIYVSITGYLLQLINIPLAKDKSIQYFMLDHTVFHDILIDTYRQGIFHTFMSEDGQYKTFPFN